MVNIPGSNILKRAQSLINTQNVNYYQFTGNTINSSGIKVKAFAPVVVLKMNVQAVNRSMYDRLGLDYSKRYVEVWASYNVEDIYRDRSNDEIGFAGRRYAAVSKDDWFPIDRYDSFIAVDIGADV